jgi:NADPH:quinone reductase-like Zn-dependent oxidoreductase
LKTFQLRAGEGLAGLKQRDIPSPAIGPNDIRVRIRAAAINARDLSIAKGTFPNVAQRELTPLSDGCGEVVECGPLVTRFKPGDRVVTTFYANWWDGAIAGEKVSASFGAQLDGTLAEEVVASELSFAVAPSSLDDLSASTLTCAGVTAWNALFGGAVLEPGATVLLLGTGGVSIWALQLAAASGFRTIITSSSDEKLARAKELGAHETVNYRTNPEWQKEVLRLTGGRGVDLVVEVGGEGTLGRSLEACRMGGSVVVVGRVSGGGSVPILPGQLIGGAKQLRGITAGSRAMLERLIRFVDVARLRPVIDRTFKFEDARAAYEYLEAAQHFGKIVIQVA